MLVYFLSGPLSGYLIERFGERKVAIAGSLIAGIGMTSSAFVNSVPALLLTYGIISGKNIFGTSEVNKIHFLITDVLNNTCYPYKIYANLFLLYIIFTVRYVHITWLSTQIYSNIFLARP